MITTNRYQDLLAFLLTLVNVWLQLPAVVEQICAVGISTALVAKVRRGILSVSALVGKSIHESDGNDIDIRIVAV